MTTDRSGNSLSPHASRGKTLRVLCAEDHEQVALILKCALERDGYFVECVEDGQTAFERIMSDVSFFDVLMTDHQMPRLSGLGLVMKLRDTAFSGVIIVHSAHLLPADLHAYRALAVDRILAKPTELATLLTIVQQLVENVP